MKKADSKCLWKELGCAAIECELNGVAVDDCIINGFLSKADEDLSKVIEENGKETIRRIYALGSEPKIPGTQSKS